MADAPDAELQLPPDARYVGLARLVVTTAARQAGMDPGRVEDLKIAVSEATTNAIMAHRQQGSPEPVVLLFGPREDAFNVAITDAGPGFEPTSPQTAENLDWSAEGGLGVTLIRGLADTVEFVREAGMRVQMRFRVGFAPEDLHDDEQPSPSANGSPEDGERRSEGGS